MKLTGIFCGIVFALLFLTNFSSINADFSNSNLTVDDSMIGGMVEDRYEDNDDIGNASTIRTGIYSNLSCTDNDWYKISLTTGQDLTVIIRFNNSEGDLDLELYSLYGIMDRSQSTTDSESVSQSNFNYTGYCFIKVFGHNNSINNYTMELNNADITPPKIISRLLVKHNSPTSVNISWVADEMCSSVLRYGTYSFGYFLGQLTNTGYSYNHTYTLTNLTPLATYNYWITLSDRNNNSQETGPFIFRTMPATDSSDPELKIIVPDVISGRAIVRAVAVDESGIEKVEFYLNGTYMFTDYSNDYQWLFDTVEFDNGPFAIGAKAFDRTGRYTYVEKNVTVSNSVPDTTPPIADFISLRDGLRVNGGNVSVIVSSYDMDSGIKSIEFYVDGRHVWTELLNGEAGSMERATYYWNTYDGNRTALHDVTVKVTNNDGISSSSSVGVYSDNPTLTMTYPKDVFAIKPFELTRGQVRREKTYYEVILYIKNLCSKELYSIVVEDYNVGFQTISFDYGYQQKAHYVPSEKTSYIRFPIGNLKPGEIKTLKYYMVPILFAPDPRIDFIIGEKTIVKYKESQGVKIPTNVINYNVPSVEMMDGWFSTTSVPITTGNVLTPMNSRDYLVVTHPQNLFAFYDDGKVNELLSKLAEFSRHKNAVLGYLRSTTAACEEILDAINPNLQFKLIIHGGGDYDFKIVKGGWNNLLTPSWSNDGYLLLVGEIGIVPSFISLGWNIVWGGGHETPDIKFTDLPFADLTGDSIPELKVGRLIGNNIETLIRQVDTSLGVELGRAGYKFDKSHAMLISGTGSSYKSFVKNVNEMEDILTPQGHFVTKVHGYEYIPMDDFYFDFEIYDKLGVGNIYYGSMGEIVVGSWKDDKVYIYQPDGTLLKSFTHSLDWRDSMVVGDIMGDDKDEICIIDYYTGELEIFQGYVYGGSPGPEPSSRATGTGLEANTRAPAPGTLMITKVGSFDTDYYYIDDVSIGDVWGDEKDEIVLADESADKILIYDYLGNVVNSFNCPIYYYDGLAVGDAHSNSKEEIITANSMTDVISIRSNTGSILTSFAFSYGYGNTIAVGDFYDQANEEIIIGNNSDKYVYICYYKNNKWNAGKTPVEIPYNVNDGLAIGNVVDDGLHEIVVGNNIENKIQYFDKYWSDRLTAAFMANYKFKDIIHYSGHGNINKFGSFISSSSYFPLDFGGTNPVVIAPSCLCGDYVNGDIAESFLDSGAGAFIGSTEISRIPENAEAGKLLYGTYWNQNSIDIGTAFTNLCRDQYPLTSHWPLWVTEFNLYGDPKYGTTDAELPVYDFIPLPGHLFKIELNDFEFDTSDGFDYVQIPGGRTLFETNTYQVPIYSETILIPNGYTVQNVKIKNQSKLMVAQGFNLPITRNEISVSGYDTMGAKLSTFAGSGWFPEETYKWQIIQNANGSSSLVITIYPFKYNSKTSEIKYYKDFEFDIDYIQSSITIKELLLDEEFDFGETAEAEITLANSGSADIAILLSGDIISYLNITTVAGTQLQALNLRPGETSTTVSFNTNGLTVGYHSLKVIIEDNYGAQLDTATVRFKVGKSEVSVTDLAAEPELFNIGHSIKIDMTYENSGSVYVSGDLKVIIKNEDGELVKEFSANFTELQVTTAEVLEVVWSTMGINHGKYYITGYVLYNNKIAVSPAIVVKDIATELRDIIEYIKTLGLPKGIENSLISKLENAAMAVEKGQYKTTLQIIQSFINEMEAAKDKKISEVQAEVMVEKVENVINNMGG